MKKYKKMKILYDKLKLITSFLYSYRSRVANEQITLKNVLNVY